MWIGKRVGAQSEFRETPAVTAGCGWTNSSTDQSTPRINTTKHEKERKTTWTHKVWVINKISLKFLFRFFGPPQNNYGSSGLSSAAFRVDSLVGFSPVQPDATDEGADHPCDDDGEPYPPSIHLFSLNRQETQNRARAKKIPNKPTWTPMLKTAHGIYYLWYLLTF